VEGQTKEKGKYWLAHLTWDTKTSGPKVEFLPADEYKGKDLYSVYPNCLSGLARMFRLLAAAWRVSMAMVTLALHLMTSRSAPADMLDAEV